MYHLVMPSMMLMEEKQDNRPERLSQKWESFYLADMLKYC